MFLFYAFSASIAIWAIADSMYDAWLQGKGRR